MNIIPENAPKAHQYHVEISLLTTKKRGISKLKATHVYWMHFETFILASASAYL